MKVDDKKIDEIAHLARLEFDTQEKEALKSDLEKIIGFCNQLNNVDTENIQPLVYMSSETNVLRQDIVKQELEKSLALKNAPSADSDYFKVPKVIKK